MSHSRSKPLTVEEVRTRFEQWRQNRQGRARIPDELWSAAIELARRDGVNQTASALRLDGGKLKRIMAPGSTVADKPTPPAFLELMPSSASGLPEYTLELASISHEGKGERLGPGYVWQQVQILSEQENERAFLRCSGGQ
jgi:hypothetical protein